MSGIEPINPVQLMGQSLVEGIGVSARPKTPEETQVAFTELLLDKVFFKELMNDNESIFTPEKDNLFGSSAEVSMYKDMVRKEIIRQMASDGKYGFSELFAENNDQNLNTQVDTI
jgi:Rod binding protein